MPKTETLLSVGDKAPDFTLNTCQGEPRRLSGLLAQGNVMLLFFRGTW